ALEAGADIVNDISGLTRDPEMIQVVCRHRAACVVMHMRGTPQTMQQFTDYENVTEEVDRFFSERMRTLSQAGIDTRRIALDPGIGFSKTWRQNLQLLRELRRFTRHGAALLLGVSRKSFIGYALNIEQPAERIFATAGAVACGFSAGARIMRVHDVAQMRDVVDICSAILWDHFPRAQPQP
ncbi:MAG: dihydropteroate synthase, partial [Lentisphaerae bacterium]